MQIRGDHITGVSNLSRLSESHGGEMRRLRTLAPINTGLQGMFKGMFTVMRNLCCGDRVVMTFFFFFKYRIGCY